MLVGAARSICHDLYAVAVEIEDRQERGLSEVLEHRRLETAVVRGRDADLHGSNLAVVPVGVVRRRTGAV
jgi:hypothetical protein